jgi:hypothetical protein
VEVWRDGKVAVPWGRMTRSWWVVFGTLGGLCFFGAAAVLVRRADPEATLSLFTLFLIPAAGLVIGGLVGSRAPRMATTTRAVFGAVLGASFLAAIGGTAFLLFLGGSGGGLARFQGKNFVIGAIVGGVVGLVLGGLVGARTARPAEGSPTV